jgi:hypothetical protein
LRGDFVLSAIAGMDKSSEQKGEKKLKRKFKISHPLPKS